MHPWLVNFDWTGLQNFSLEVPYRPNYNFKLDVGNSQTQAAIKYHQKRTIISDQDQQRFVQFKFPRDISRESPVGIFSPRSVTRH